MSDYTHAAELSQLNIRHALHKGAFVSVETLYWYPRYSEASHCCGGMHAHFPPSMLATKGTAGRDSLPDALIGQDSGRHGINDVSTVGPQQNRPDCVL